MPRRAVGATGGVIGLAVIVVSIAMAIDNAERILVRTTIVVAVTKQGNAITPTRMFQALAMDIYGRNIGFGLTPAQAMAPTYTGE